MVRLLSCALGISLTLLQTRAHAGLPFVLGPEFDAGIAPWGCVVGDFDGADGIDIAVTNAAVKGEVSILLGIGDGNFIPMSQIALNKEPRGIASGDFNADGNLDLVISSVSDDPTDIVSVLLGNGDGTFAEPVEYEVGAYPNVVKAADLNGDDSSDIVAISTGGEALSVFLGMGDGTFAARMDYSLPNFLPWGIAIKDVDGDKVLDVVVSAFSTFATFALLKGVGDGTFLPPDYVGTNGSHSSLAVDDFNLDGRLDVALLDRSIPRVDVFYGNSVGGFERVVSFPVASHTSSIEAGDLYGNGQIQIVAAGFDGIHVFNAIGSGRFTDMGAISGAHGGENMVIADLNDDGSPDIFSPRLFEFLSSAIINTTLFRNSFD
ncbi:FG-GAP repeat domain-containing protein [Dokdonella sp.]|uniref:FG-GAP repeat domain-containing protein n=1 Tax=Dokdonella sp. TaxID=2291710 RepID=UPI00352805E8